MKTEPVKNHDKSRLCFFKKLSVLHVIFIILFCATTNYAQVPQHFVSVKDYGAMGDGVANDTTAINAAFNAVNNSGGIYRGLLFPAGFYMVDHLEFDDGHDMQIWFEGAIICGVSTASQPSVITFNRAHNLNIDGHLSVDVQSRLNYACGVEFKATPGVLTGSLSRVNVHNLTCYNAQLALKLNDYNVDSQCSEMSFFGFSSFGCPQVVYIGGSQTGASFIGCNMCSEANSDMLSVPCLVAKLEGGFMTITGGEFLNCCGTNGWGFYLCPSQSSTFSSPYPVVRITGTHIECSSQLAEICNPRGISSPYSNGMAQFSVTGSGGYVSTAASAIDFVAVTDPTFAGTIQFADCMFYSDITSGDRTAYNITAQPLTRVEIDKTSFGKCFKHWLGGVNGGILRHDNQQIIYADNLNSQAVPANSTVTLKYSVKAVSGLYEHYQSAYNATTGVFTYPAGGLETVHLEAVANVTSGTPVGSIAIYKDGVIDTVGTISGKTLSVQSTYCGGVPAGTTLEVEVQNTSSTAFSFSISPRDKLAIYASN